MGNIIHLVWINLIPILAILEIIILVKQLKEPNVTKSQKKGLILWIILFSVPLLIYVLSKLYQVIGLP